MEVAAPARPAVVRALLSPALVSCAVWGLVYAVVATTGQRFSTAYLGYGWQLVPFEILEDDPLGSVWHLHIQPPLWNLALGGTVRLSPLTDALTLQLLQLALGLVMVALLADLLGRLRFTRWVAVGLTLVATLNPEVMKNAFEPTYELAVAAGLVAVAWAAARLAGQGRARDLVVLAALATTVVMTRSLYHPVWALAVLGLGAWSVRRSVSWRAVAGALAVPLVVCGAWVVKNDVLFGRATLSSWFGMNLQRSVLPVLDVDDRDRMLARGELSEVSRIGPFGNYDLYRPVMPPCTPERRHRAVTVEARFDDDVLVPNFNFECFLPVFDRAGDDAWAVIREHPEAWLEGRAWSARTTFAVSSLPSESSSAPLRTLDDVFRVVRADVPGTISTSGWGTPIYGTLDVEARFSLTMVATSVLLVVLGAWSFVQLLRGRGDAVRTLVLAVVGFTVAWTFAVGIVGELGEQARFRTMTDPLVLALGLGEVLRRLAGWFRWRWVAQPAQPAVGR